MNLLTGEQVARRISGLIHHDTQVSDFSVDLTVDEIFQVASPGALDFGGSEYREAERERMRPELADPDDDYGWWKLAGGHYIVTFNESIAPREDECAFVQPHTRLMLAGGHHPSFHFGAERAPLETLLTVGERGCHLKENCRVSKLVIRSAD